jgi:1,4-alpha-glucan branching enzyme
LSIKKQYLKTRPICKVTFRLSKEESKDAKKIFLVGDFNSWDENKLPMKSLKKGGFVANLDLQTGNEYQFRYFFDKLAWGNDPEADNYVHSSFGNCDNSVISL